MAKEMRKRLFTLQEAANYLGLPTKRIYEAVRRRATQEARERFPVKPKRHGKIWLFEKKDLDAYADSIPYQEVHDV
jgi:hypothetical protein